MADNLWVAHRFGVFQPEFVSSSNQEAGQQLCDSIHESPNTRPGSNCFSRNGLFYPSGGGGGTAVCRRILDNGELSEGGNICTFQLTRVVCPSSRGGLQPFNTVSGVINSSGCSCEGENLQAVNDPENNRVGCEIIDSAKDDGCGLNNTPHPCNIATGNKYRSEVDFSNGALSFIRHYNSRFFNDIGMGIGWRHNYQNALSITGNFLTLISNTGRGEPWERVNEAWVGDADSDYLLSQTDSGYVLTKKDSSSEKYDLEGLLLSETDTNGHQTVYSYDDDNNLVQVTNIYGQSVSFTYVDGKVSSVTDPFGAVYSYKYDQNSNLISVIYPDETPDNDQDNPRKIYHYEDEDFPNHLTGITDENGDRYGNFAYDNEGKAVMSELGVTSNQVGQEKVELNFITFTNLALNRVTEQSSIAAGGTSNRANDDNTNGNFFSGSTTHTNSELQPWWQVDLGSQAVISNVNIFNRTDCCSDRLFDFYVFVSEVPFGNQSLSQILENNDISRVYHEGTLSNSSISLQLPSNGRYVRVQLAQAGVISLAEVQVIGREEN